MDRMTELKTALRQRVEENDRITQDFKIEDNGGVVVSTEQATAFRKNLEDARQIKEIMEGITLVKDAHDLIERLDMSPSDSAAIAAGAMQSLGGLSAPGVKTVGEVFTGSQEFKDLLASGSYTMRNDWQVEGIDLGSMWVGLNPSGEQHGKAGMEQKDVYTSLPGTFTNRGFGSSQRDAMVPRQFRTLRVRDLFPNTTTSANLIEYFRVSGFTNAASVVPERDGGAFALKPQSALSFSPAQAPVRLIAHFEVAHRNVLADEPQLQGIINNELLYGLRLQEDYQILQGTGTGEDLLGILNTPGVQVYNQASGPGTDNKADAIRRAATKAILAYYEPTGIVVHPYDWEDIELTKDANNRYIVAGSVAVGAQQMLWRQPVVDTPAIPEGTYLTGAWGLGAQLYDRQLASIRIAEQHADFFVRNAVVILAEQRLALATKRPESFVKGTLAA